MQHKEELRAKRAARVSLRPKREASEPLVVRSRDLLTFEISACSVSQVQEGNNCSSSPVLGTGHTAPSTL